MGKPTPQELALMPRSAQLRERIAKIEQGRQAEARLVGEIDLQSLARIRVPAQENDARHTGITVIGDVPWGTHFCQFYQDKQDLIDILVPYFKAGLENNEFCIWITSEPLARMRPRPPWRQKWKTWKRTSPADNWRFWIVESFTPSVGHSNPIGHFRV
jgi:hypothetical protein